jgi:uncharacterized protein (TIGR02246 family)
MATSELTSSDTAAIEATVRAFETYWNAHDMDSYAKLFTEDAQLVNVVGMWWRSRQQIMIATSAYHASFFKDNRVEISSIESHAIATGVAIAVIKLKQSAFVRPDGVTEPERTDILSFVLVNGDGGWLIAHCQNTVVDQEAAPFDPVNAVKS